MVDVLVNKINLFFLFLVFFGTQPIFANDESNSALESLSSLYSSSTISDSSSTDESVPEVEPYQLPTLDGRKPVIDDRIEPLVKAPSIDADALFNRLVDCYPAVSKWKLDVELKASTRAGEAISTLTGTDLGRNYVEIVASMPLYSATELERRQRNEYDLRNDTAKRVADFVAAISTRNHALRELALFKSLEARAAIRVKAGVTEASEQVGYLKEVANSQDNLIKSEAKIMETRLALSSLCSKTNYPRINSYLKNLAKIPINDQ